MQGNQTFLDPPEAGSAQDAKRATERKTMSFSFDKSYWSAGPRGDPGYCSQQTLFNDLGKELLAHGFAGFNACILACKLPVSHVVAALIDCVWLDGQTGMITIHALAQADSVQDRGNHTGMFSKYPSSNPMLLANRKLKYDGV